MIYLFYMFLLLNHYVTNSIYVCWMWPMKNKINMWQRLCGLLCTFIVYSIVNFDQITIDLYWNLCVKLTFKIIMWAKPSREGLLLTMFWNRNKIHLFKAEHFFFKGKLLPNLCYFTPTHSYVYTNNTRYLLLIKIVKSCAFGCKWPWL